MSEMCQSAAVGGFREPGKHDPDRPDRIDEANLQYLPR